jgi:hypothetical protein
VVQRLGTRVASIGVKVDELSGFQTWFSANLTEAPAQRVEALWEELVCEGSEEGVSRAWCVGCDLLSRSPPS